jgi:hypothetical protein
MSLLMTAHDGEVHIDHRASPGIGAAQAERMGLPASLVGEGKQMRARVTGCPHCGSAVMLNPLRDLHKHPRPVCYQCSHYICDICDGVRHDPDYVHRTIEEIAAMVHSGRWQLTGSMSKPIMVPVEG